MAEPAGPFRVLRAGPGRVLCYCRAGAVCATDGADVWAAELGAGPGPEVGAAELRAALGRGAVALGMAPGGAELSLRGGDGRAPLQLCVLPRAEAAAQLRALLFAMAASIEDLERQLGAALGASCSPEKNTARSQRSVLPDPSPRKIAGAGSAPSAKRKIPGESLINPGFKSKKVPSGVDFEDS